MVEEGRSGYPMGRGGAGSDTLLSSLPFPADRHVETVHVHSSLELQVMSEGRLVDPRGARPLH